MIGTHAVIVTPLVPETGPYSAAFSGAYDYAAAELDMACDVDSVKISHGRSGSSGQPEPSSATVDISVDAARPLPKAVDVGAWLDVTTTVGGVTSVRFRGRITDTAMGWDDYGEDTPTSGVCQVTAISTMAELARRYIGAAPFPSEDDGDRIYRAALLAGVTLDLFLSDPGTVRLLPHDVDFQPALAVMRATADWASGVVWHERDGTVRYTDARGRRSVPAALTLDACDVLVTPTWTRNLDGLTNELSVSYGVAPGGPGGGEQPRYGVVDEDSQNRWGRYAVSLTTELAAQADAVAMGNLRITRNNRPAWVLSALPVAVADLDLAHTLALLSLELSDLVVVTDLPPMGAAPTTLTMWVEGWTETLTGTDHALELALSDFCRTSAPVKWDDPYAETWDTVPDAATRTWDESVCWGPIPGIGRWDDTRPATRWDLVDPAITWDTWEQSQREEAWAE